MTPSSAPPASSGFAARLPLRRLVRRDRRLLLGVVAAAIALQVALVWLPALASMVLSLTSWDGIGGLESIHVVGLRNYATLLSSDPRFWSAVVNNALWLVALGGVAVPVGIALAAVLDRQVRGVRAYQTAFYLPMLLSLALVGLIWELQYSTDQGFLNGILGRTAPGSQVDWLGDRSINRWAVLVAATWRHVGYVLVLYLAGLRTVDPALRDAARIDGASERQAFLRVVLPSLRPVTVVVLVITAIEALRAFDIVYVVNGGLNGLELLGVLVTANIAGEASRIGYGSAVATVLLAISIVPIVAFIRRMEREPAA